MSEDNKNGQKPMAKPNPVDSQLANPNHSFVTKRKLSGIVESLELPWEFI
jgi:hypothetical protein